MIFQSRDRCHADLWKIQKLLTEHSFKLSRLKSHFEAYCVKLMAFSEEHAMTDAIDNDEEEFVESTLIQAIENQIESDNPPAAKATFNKLTLVGYEREEILQLMAHVLAIEIDALLEADRPFDSQWYEQALRALPELPPEA